MTSRLAVLGRMAVRG